MHTKRIIIKLGTSTLTAGGKTISLPHLLELVKEVSSIRDQGYDVILISSGAIAIGKDVLNFPNLDKHLPAKQMLAAVGQSRLMEVYNKLFQMYGKNVGQVLLTRDDLMDRRRFLNARNTLEALLEYGVIPIINENDTVATEEIRLGDNDNLSAQVANLVEADLLILMTDQDGLFTADPRKKTDAQMVKQVDSIDIPESLWQAAGRSVSGLGTGGMETKLMAADLARRSGTTVVITNGNFPANLQRIINEEEIGTRFLPVTSKIESRKRFLLAHTNASEEIIRVDTGAANALCKGGSLLPVGVREVVGEFSRGDIVKVETLKGKIIATGLINYGSIDLRKIAGLKSNQIDLTLGYSYGEDVIHHNNLIVINHE